MNLPCVLKYIQKSLNGNLREVKVKYFDRSQAKKMKPISKTF